MSNNLKLNRVTNHQKNIIIKIKSNEKAKGKYSSV